MISKEVISHDRKQENIQKPASDEITEKITTSYQLYHHNHIGNTMYLTDITGKKTSEYTYGPYGELTGAKDLKNDRTENIQERFLFQGKYGVETEANGLYYMRTRYYNTDIKRFISRDIVAGSIADSNSLNRYSYVEGNPISKTDPFGLSPDITFSEIGHSILDVIGFFPVGGDLADLANAATYYIEGDTSAGNASLFCAIPVFGSVIGQSTKIVKKGAKLGKQLTKATSMVGNAAEVAEDVVKSQKDGLKLAIQGYHIKKTSKGAELATKLRASGQSSFKKTTKQLRKEGAEAQAEATAEKLGKSVGKSGSKTKKYYQVTSKENAQALINLANPSLKGTEFKEVYVWTVQPTLKQAKNSGARYLDTVIEFETNATFSRDTSIVDSSLWDIARVSDRPGPISIFNVVEVGFKKGKRWWKFWKK